MGVDYLPRLMGRPEVSNLHTPTLSCSFAVQERGPVGGLRKRQFDLFFTLLSIIALAPLFVLVALAIKACDPGPVFFRHRRIGNNGETFECLKFRTMRPDGNALLERHFTENPEAKLEWLTTRKLKNDPRVTAIGDLLRKTSIDELPQIINIILGQMSIVGPRPVVGDEIELYGSDARYYFATRPGLTGAWQVGGRNDVSYEERVRLDRAYVENWSLISDVAIILRTVPAVFMSRGSY